MASDGPPPDNTTAPTPPITLPPIQAPIANQTPTIEQPPASTQNNQTKPSPAAPIAEKPPPIAPPITNHPPPIQPSTAVTNNPPPPIQPAPTQAAAPDETKEIPGIGQVVATPEESSFVVSGDPDDVKTWLALAKRATGTTDAVAQRGMFEKILEKFPMSSRHWLQYCESELKRGETKRVEALIKRCLIGCCNIQLWLFYLKYIDDHWSAKNNPDKELVCYEKRKAAYEFALQYAGFYINAGQLWMDYLTLLKTQKADSQYDKSQRMTTVRRAYQRAVLAPTDKMEVLWREYESFENDISKHTAQKLLTEFASLHAKALVVMKERQALWSRLVVGRIPEKYRGNAKEEDQVRTWVELIEFEKSNPETLEPAPLVVRVRCVYTQALAAHRFSPELWYHFLSYTHSQSDLPSLMTLLQQCLSALPRCVMLHLFAADLYELYGLIKRAKEVLERIVEQDEIAAWIRYIGFVRRNEGVDKARQVFLRARKSPNCSHQIYSYCAMQEFRVNNSPKVARRIFELGMKKYSKEPRFAMAYIDFAKAANRPNDLFDLFERLLSSLAPADAKPVWLEYRSFCLNTMGTSGDLKALESVERRMMSVYPNDPSLSGIASVLHRYDSGGCFQNTNSPDDKPIFASYNHFIGETFHHSKLPNGSPTPGLSGPAESVPLFLRELVSLLPRQLRGPAPNSDRVLMKLKNFKMPERPKEDMSRIPGVSVEASRKRAAPEEGFTSNSHDLYAIRQKLS